MSQRTIDNISKDGLDDHHARVQHAQRTGQWLTFPPPVLDEYPTFTAAFNAKRKMRKMLMKSKQEVENEAQEKERLVMEGQRMDTEFKRQYEMAETERINDEKHRKQVHNNIWAGFKGLQIMKTLNTLEHRSASKFGQELTQALIDGKIPHTKIEY